MENKLVKRDQLYFILSILVIMLHSVGYEFYDLNGIELSNTTKVISDFLQYAITRIAMPCFFIFNGMLFHHGINSFKDLGMKLKSRIHTIVIPYFVWNLISIIWNWLVSNLPFLSKNTSVRDEFILTKESFINGLFFFKYNQHNWFLAQIIIFLALSPVVYLLLKKKIVGIVSYLVIVVLYVTNYYLPINLQDHSALYYFLGALIGSYWYKDFVKFSNSLKGKKITGILCLIGSILIQSIVYYLGVDFLRAGIPYIFAALLFWMFINTLEHESRIKSCYKYFYLIFLSHFIVLSCVNKLCWLFLPKGNIWCILNLLIGVFGTTGIIVLAGFIMKKNLKPLYSILTGGK